MLPSVGFSRVASLASGGGAERFAELYLVIPDRDLAGPGTRRLADVIAKTVAETCPEAARIDTGAGELS